MSQFTIRKRKGKRNMQCCPNLFRNLTVLLAFGFVGVFVLAVSTKPFADDKEEKVLRHVVMFEFKSASSEEDVKGVVDEFRALPKKIPEIVDFEYGTNNSPEELNDGFTHCFLVTFKSEKDREVYLPHPAHKAFVEVLKPHLEKVMVIDYWAAE